MDTYEGLSEKELYRMKKLNQWQKDIMDRQNVQKTILERFRDQNDPVNHPSHYTDGKIEVIDFIEDKKLGFHLGNAVKHIARAGKKDPSKEVEDLKKAVWYINRRIANISEDTDGDSELVNQKIEPLTNLEANIIYCKEDIKND